MKKSTPLNFSETQLKLIRDNRSTFRLKFVTSNNTLMLLGYNPLCGHVSLFHSIALASIADQILETGSRRAGVSLVQNFMIQVVLCCGLLSGETRNENYITIKYIRGELFYVFSKGTAATQRAEFKRDYLSTLNISWDLA
jgi:hypothetical protein